MKSSGSSLTILTIGLDSSLLDEITSTPTLEVIEISTCDEATPILQAREISTVVFDSGCTHSLQSDVDILLSATPVTTRIVLITPSTDVLVNSNLTGLGVATLTSPVSYMDLVPFLAP